MRGYWLFPTPFSPMTTLIPGAKSQVASGSTVKFEKLALRSMAVR